MPANSKKVRPRGPSKIKTSSDSTSRWSISSHPLLVALVTAVLAAISSLTFFQLQRPKPSDEEALTAITEQSHTYSFVIDGRTISGESRAPFEKANGYYARVEACERFGMEAVYNIVSCYLTVRPYLNITISNSDNPTSAVYDDGRPAVVCCMYGENFSSGPLYRITLPPGDVKRRTYQRGSEIHLMFNVPDADQDHELDAISFSPGQGVSPTLFPLRDRTRDRMIPASQWHKDENNPEVQRLVQQGLRMKADIMERKKTNMGLTYAPWPEEPAAPQTAPPPPRP